MNIIKNKKKLISGSILLAIATILLVIIINFQKKQLDNKNMTASGLANTNSSGLANTNSSGLANTNSSGLANTNSSGLANTNSSGLIFLTEEEKKLKEIKEFIDGGHDSEEIRNWAKKEKLQIEHLEKEIDLEGANKKKLITLSVGSSDSEIAKKAKGKSEKFKKYRSIRTSGDGNCFLNSFSVLLTGSQDVSIQKKTSLILRILMCLEIMINYDSNCIDEIERLKIYAKNNEWLATDDAKHIVKILRRPVIMIFKDDEYPIKFPEQGGIIWNRFDQFNQIISKEVKFDYKEPFYVYHVAGCHFEPLIQNDNHEEGIILFKSNKITIDNQENNRSVTFDITNLVTENFSSVNSNKLNNISFNNQIKIRIWYNSGINSLDEFNRIVEEKIKIKEGNIVIGIREKNKYVIFIDNLDISVKNDEIQLPWESYEEINVLPIK